MSDATQDPDAETQSSYSRDALVYSIGSGLVGVVYFVYTMICARVLGPDRYGLYQALMGIVSLFLVCSLPLNLCTVHLVGGAGSREALSRALSACIRVALALGALCFAGLAAASPLVAASLKLDSIWGVWVVGGVVCANLTLATIHGGLQGRGRYGLLSLARGIEALVTVCAGSLFMYAGFGAVGAAAGFLVTMTLQVLGLRLAGYAPLQRVGLAPIRAEFSSVLQPFAVTVALMWVASVPMIVARVRLDANDAGAYACLFGIRYIVLAFAQAVTWPMYSRLVAKPDDLRHVRIALGAVLFLGTGLLIGMALLGEFVIGLIFGAEYVALATPYAVSYAFFLALHMLAMLVLFVQAARGQLRAWTLAAPVGITAYAALDPALDPARLILLQVLAWAAYLLLASGMAALDRSRSVTQNG